MTREAKRMGKNLPFPIFVCGGAQTMELHVLLLLLLLRALLCIFRSKYDREKHMVAKKV